MTWFDEAVRDGRLKPSKVSLLELELPLLWRVYPKRFGVQGFNHARLGSGRFSPLDIAAATVPTLYAGSTLDVALMETVWHDAPVPSNGFHLVLNESTETRRVGSLKPSAPLRLVDLTTIGLRRLGLTRTEVIDSGPLDYPITRRLAAWLYENKADAQGICWVSRQSDEGRAVVLFEPRMGRTQLVPATRDEIFTDGPHLDAVLTLTERLGATVIVR